MKKVRGPRLADTSWRALAPTVVPAPSRAQILAPRGAHLVLFSDWTLLGCERKGHTCANASRGRSSRPAPPLHALR